MRQEKLKDKKICFLANNLNVKNGAGRFVGDLIKYTQEHSGLNVMVLTTINSGHPLEKTLIYPSKIKLLFSLLKIRNVIKKYDIIHAVDVFPYGIIAVIASIGLRKKIVITAVGSGSIQPLYRYGFKLLSKKAYNRADKLTAISSFVAREINKKIPNLDFQIIIPGINFNYFKDKLREVQDKENTDLVSEEFILSVARLKPRKGLHVSLKVFAKVRERFPSLKYVIVGSGRGQYYNEMQDLIMKLGIGDSVIFKQSISDHELVSLYKNAKIFLLLPQNIDNDVEGFGLVYVEAAAFGLPVIGALDSGAEDAVDDKHNGFLVAPDDIDGASERIIEIISNDNLKQKFSKNSIELAKKNDWENIIKQYIMAYHNL